MPWLKIIRVFLIVFAWAKTALKDGRITIQEALDLILKLAALLGIPTSFDVNELTIYVQNLRSKTKPISEEDQKP